ncbi:MAG: branched-chain amino acid ABC transporter permease [Deltaproteobacteria bacterium]|nr:branched-chain amino acid ABC transporter permease [Deltaproteobacteria bacterium]
MTGHSAHWGFKGVRAAVPSALILFCLIVLPGWGTAYHVSLLTSVFLYIILTVSWALFSGPTGYMSLASAAFFGVGVYTTAVMGENLPLLLDIAAGGVFSFLLALLVGLSCLRLRGVYFCIFSFGLSELILHSVLFYEMEVTGTVGRLVVGTDEKTVYYIMLIIIVILLCSVFLLRSSKYWLALRGIGQAESAASHIGVNVNRLKVIVFAFTAFFMGAAGAAMVTQWTYVDSRTAFNMFYSFMPVVMAIFGGVQSVWGQIVGAIILTLLAESLLIKFPYLYMLFFGILVLAVILFFPKGVIGLADVLKKDVKGHQDI